VHWGGYCPTAYLASTSRAAVGRLDRIETTGTGKIGGFFWHEDGG
jgi:hypothetical protein